MDIDLNGALPIYTGLESGSLDLTMLKIEGAKGPLLKYVWRFLKMGHILMVLTFNLFDASS